MLSLAGYAPLVVAGVVAVAITFREWLPPIDRIVTRAALVLGPTVGDRPDRRRLLGAAASAESYRIYTAETRLLATCGAILAGIGGVYLTAGLLASSPVIVAALDRFPSISMGVAGEESLSVSLSLIQLVLAQTIGGVTAAGLAAGGIVGWRWQRLRNRAAERRRAIDAATPRTVAFMYALTRGGTSVTEAMTTIGQNRAIYGAAADEIGVAVREMELFGSDVVSATQRMAYRSPSERFRTFGENLASVLESGRSLAEFFREQYQQYREGAIDRQAELLERLATIAEAYVTVLVAGMLFLVTILLVIGLTIADTLGVVRALVYVIIPLANLGVIVYLDQSIQGLNVAETTPETGSPDRTHRSDPSSASDPVDRQTHRRLAIADRIRGLRSVLATPKAAILQRPRRTIAVSAPIALLITGSTLVELDLGAVPIRAIDDAIVGGLLLVIVPYSVIRELHRRRLRRIEAAVPDLLDRLASLTEAGMSLVESIETVRNSDLGPLDPDVEALWRDIRLGATVTEAIDRFQLRVGTTTIARVMTLVTNAHHASGSVGPVLRIAADDVRSTLRLRRQRRQQMLTYLIVIYIAFGVFVLITLVIRLVLIPSLPELGAASANAGQLPTSGSPLAQIGTSSRPAYALVLSHAALIQAACSGVVAGQIGEGRAADGLKHVAIMVGFAYLLFVVLTGPVATLSLTDDPVGSAGSVEVESVTLADGGYVVVYEGDSSGPILGWTPYLPAGTHDDVTIDIDPPIQSVELTLVVHTDDGDRQFGDVTADHPYPSGPGRQRVSIQT